MRSIRAATSTAWPLLPGSPNDADDAGDVAAAQDEIGQILTGDRLLQALIGQLQQLALERHATPSPQALGAKTRALAVHVHPLEEPIAVEQCARRRC